MSKNIKPEKGYPMTKVAEEITSNDDTISTNAIKLYSSNGTNEYPSAPSDYMMDDIRNAFCDFFRLINGNACGTERQICELFNHLKRSLDAANPSLYSEQRELAENNQPLKDDITELGRLELESFVQIINGFRHECINCLTKNCKRRDPSHPWEDVDLRFRLLKK